MLLSNGNLIAQRRRRRHRPAFRRLARPVPQAVLSVRAGRRRAGRASRTRFTTMSGRKVALRIYVEPGKEDRCGLRHGQPQARHALGRGGVRPRIRSRHLHDRRRVRTSIWARWRTRASISSTTNTCWRRRRPPPTPTTRSIEAVIAHEYFHNWTGDRITCRDWFQLCLKEGLTVFRDQEFTADMRSRAGEADRRRAGAARAPVRRGCRPARPSGAAGALSRDQQLLHRDGLRKRRRSGAHDQDAARAGKIPRRHGSLFRPP